MRDLACIFVCALAATVAAQPMPSPSAEPLALINANIIGVRDGRVASRSTIVIRNGRIESIAPGAAPAGVRAVDLRGKFVLPGLIDAHTHASDFAAFRRALESGVTTVRSAGVSHYVDVGFNQLVKNGVVAGPNVISAGYHLRPQMASEAFLGNNSICRSAI
jgi:imidazolonepropionase-like amidohydrolase